MNPTIIKDNHRVFVVSDGIVVEDRTWGGAEVLDPE